jgi:hypothetical protein
LLLEPVAARSKMGTLHSPWLKSFLLELQGVWKSVVQAVHVTREKGTQRDRADQRAFGGGEEPDFARKLSG